MSEKEIAATLAAAAAAGCDANSSKNNFSKINWPSMLLFYYSNSKVETGPKPTSSIFFLLSSKPKNIGCQPWGIKSKKGKEPLSTSSGQ